MGDTQRSQTISTHNQRVASQAACGSVEDSENRANDKPSTPTGQFPLARIKLLAEAEPDMVFTSLAHRIDVPLLRKSFHQLRKTKSSGVDKITAKQYVGDLDENLYKLHQRLQRGQYVASPVKRIWVDKEDGRKRPIGIPTVNSYCTSYCFVLDMERVMKLLPARFNRYKLDLHPKKTKVIRFGRPPRNGKPEGTFDFLGFTFYWGKSLKGNWAIKKRTVRKRRNRFMRMVWRWCKENRHVPLKEQHETLVSKLRGFYQYFGVRSNYDTLELVYRHAKKAWKRWLGRRHRDGYLSNETFEKTLNSFELPLPRIVHDI